MSRSDRSEAFDLRNASELGQPTTHGCQLIRCDRSTLPRHAAEKRLKSRTEVIRLVSQSGLASRCDRLALFAARGPRCLLDGGDRTARDLALATDDGLEL